jgi:dihydrofolate synthase / folylpolyglutamate synthase
MNVYERLQSLETLGIKFGLQNIGALLAALDNPQERFPSVLIAGTNGKGSVGAMLHSVFFNNGYRTGHYLSPHLVDVRERIQINQKKISSKDFEDLLHIVFKTTDKIGLTTTYFETLTAAAMLHFTNTKVDLAIVEVGLGGRYDATNVIQQKLSIITSIGLDHESFLGNTLASIAAEKAAISKKGVPMITGPLPVEAEEVIRAACAETESPVFSFDSSNIVEEKLENGFPVFLYRPWDRNIRLNLRGKHQVWNAATSLWAIDVLRSSGWSVDQEKTVDAFAKVKWPGRLQIVNGFDPPFLLDCAHNAMGVETILSFLVDAGWRKVIVLFTAMRDKNIPAMLRTISPRTDQFIFTRVEPFNRCATFEELHEGIEQTGIPFLYDDQPPVALRKAMETSRDSKLPLVAFGSIYLIGRILQLLGMEA